MLWLVRLLLSSEFPASQSQTWAALWAMLGRIVAGDFQLRGCEVTEWSVCRGRERTDYVHFRVRGVGRDGRKAAGFALTVETVFVIAVEWLSSRVAMPDGLVRAMGVAGAPDQPKKIELPAT